MKTNEIQLNHISRDFSSGPRAAQPGKAAGPLLYGIVAVWFLFALVMGARGEFVSEPNRPPLALGLAVAGPLLFFILAYNRIGAVRVFCRSLDLRVTVLPHLWRIVAIRFLIDAAFGRLPWGFALPAGIGDIMIGATAIPMAVVLTRGLPSARARFITWNLGGIFDLALAITLGILHSPSAAGILARSGPTTALMSVLPRSMIPTFLVPLFILLHLLGLARRNEVTE